MTANTSFLIPKDATREQMLEIIAKQQAMIQAQKAASQRKLTLKVTEKGGLSMYGLGRFPVTLYRGQWEKLLGEKEAILAFIEANADGLSVKE